MIKINLLNSFSESSIKTSGVDSGAELLSEEDERKQIIFGFAKRAIVLVMGPLGFYIYELQTIPELQAQLADANAKYSEIKQFNDSKQGLAEEIKKYEAEQAKFQAQMDFINKIDSDKLNEYKLFQHIKNTTPASVWINKLEVAGSIITINAESDDPKDIESFIKNMANADFITNLIPINQVVKEKLLDTDVDTTVVTVKAQLGKAEASK